VAHINKQRCQEIKKEKLTRTRLGSFSRSRASNFSYLFIYFGKHNNRRDLTRTSAHQRTIHWMPVIYSVVRVPVSRWWAEAGNLQPINSPRPRPRPRPCGPFLGALTDGPALSDRHGNKFVPNWAHHTGADTSLFGLSNQPFVADLFSCTFNFIAQWERAKKLCASRSRSPPNWHQWEGGTWTNGLFLGRWVTISLAGCVWKGIQIISHSIWVGKCALEWARNWLDGKMRGILGFHGLGGKIIFKGEGQSTCAKISKKDPPLAPS